MSSGPEPILDMSEIVGLYKTDARRMVGDMRTALGQWEALAAGGPARAELRRLSHQLRGSGRTYGFRDVTRVSKAIEQIVRKLEEQILTPDSRVRRSIQAKVERLSQIFKE